MTDKVKVIAKSRMKVAQKWVAEGEECEVSKGMYENHKNHFMTASQASRSKKSKELGEEVELLKYELEKQLKANEVLKASLDAANAKLAGAGDK